MKKCVAVLVLVLGCACFIRIYLLNNAEYLKLLPNKVVYEKGESAALNSGDYYFSSYDLDGYYVKVLDYQILTVKEFLQNHDEDQSFLNKHDLPLEIDHICIVTTEFDYKGKKKVSNKKAINLAEFKIVGTDYYINPTTEFNKMGGFNSKLKGNSVFAITSGKPFIVDLAYLLPSNYENKITPDYFEQSEPKILVTYYPDERYLKLK